MPRVNDALSEAFFEAYLKNGNIRYCPMSDPVAVVTAEDKNEYLAIRVDRKFIEGRPNETAHLEFPKHRVVACIGEEFPEKFLRGLGIRLAMGGRPKKMRALVSAELETGQPRVFVVGDTLSDYHLMTSDFQAEASRFELIERTGNIKAGLLDGVRAIEVIRQRLSGAGGEAVVVPVTLARASLPAVSGEGGSAPATAEPEMTIRQMSGKEPSALVPERVAAHLVSLLVDGTKGESYPVVAGRVTTLGRTEGDITFPQDTWLDARHASLVHAPDGFLLRDDGSATGVFLRMPPGKTMPLAPGSYVRAGKRFLHFVTDADRALVEVFDRDGKQVARHELTPRLTTFGRALADIELDAEDRTLSKRHLSAQWADQQLLVADLGSRNGSYLRIPGSWKLETGDEIRLGQQRLRLEVVDDQVVQPGQGVAGEGTLTFLPRAPRLEPEAPRENVAAVPAPAGGASSECDIVFTNLGRTVHVEAEYSILEAAEENEIDIPCDCRGGTCGADPIRILSGMENLNEAEALEREWLAKFGFDGSCRFACMARVHGHVKIEILSPKKKS
jgi:ferredoxin